MVFDVANTFKSSYGYKKICSHKLKERKLQLSLDGGKDKKLACGTQLMSQVSSTQGLLFFSEWLKGCVTAFKQQLKQYCDSIHLLKSNKICIWRLKVCWWSKSQGCLSGGHG